MLSQNDTVASGTGEKITKHEQLAEMKTVRTASHGLQDQCLRHATVSSSDNPVRADQRSSTEVESAAVLVLEKCTFYKRSLSKGINGEE